MEEIRDFLRASVVDLLSNEGSGDREYLLVTGPPGSGKSTALVRALEALTEAEREHVLVTTPTHCSLRLLGDTGCRTRTLQAALGLHADPDNSTPEDVRFRFGAEGVRLDVVLVVDECSMVSGDLFKRVCSAAARAVFVGDPDQLPPVRADVRSPVFDIPRHVRLTGSHRFSASAITRPLDLIRQGEPRAAAELLPELDTAAVRAAFLDGTPTVILAWRNVVVRYWNALVHRLLGRTDIEAGTPVFTNARGLERVTSMHHGPCRTCNECPFDGLDYLEIGDTERAMIPDTDENARLLAERVRSQTRAVRSLHGARRVAAVTEWSAFRFAHGVSSLLAQRMEGLVRQVEVDVHVAYCMTVHRAQGTGVARVIIDTRDVLQAREVQQLMYVAASRAARELCRTASDC